MIPMPPKEVFDMAFSYGKDVDPNDRYLAMEQVRAWRYDFPDLNILRSPEELADLGE